MKLFILAIITGIAAVGSAAANPALKSSVRANIRESIPGTKPKQNSQIDYPMPGKLTLNAVQFCGDGDVANFAHNHPNWDHQEGGALQYVFGYWVQGPGEAPTPTTDNYFSSGSGSIDIDGASKTTFNPSTGGTSQEILMTMNSTIGMMAQLQSYRMSAGTAGAQDEFRVYEAGMICKAPVAAMTVPRDPVKVSAAMYYLKEQLLGKAHTVVSAASSFADVKSGLQVALNNDADSLQTDVGASHPIQLGTDDLSSLAAAVFGLIRPNTTDLAVYKTAVEADATLSSVKSLAAELDTKSVCADVSLVEHGKFGWEPYPLQFTCAALNSNTPGTLSSLVNALLNPAGPNAPDDAFFNGKKKQIVELLSAGAMMQLAQLSYRDRHEDPPKTRCFSAGTDYVDKVMGSMVFRAMDGPPEYSMSHPEGGFAVADYVHYYGNNEYTIFNMMNPAADVTYAKKIVRGDAPPAADAISSPKKVVLKFNVRGVGCGQNVYCWNDR